MTAIADLSMQLYDLEHKEAEVLRDLGRYGAPEQASEADYIDSWVEMVFAILSFLAQGDEEELKRLTSAREWFFESMAGWRARPGTRIIHWKRMLAARLAYFLPDHMIAAIPDSVWDPSVEEFDL
jgi:hypothetical protein